MAKDAMRVALLARPGVACDRLLDALREARADVVLVADPTEVDPERVAATGVQALLVALEPSVEDALDRYQPLLSDPAMTVIFDDAELAATREGWDAARWARHLAAKLHSHQDVLPPGGESDQDDAPRKVELYRRPESDGDLSHFADEAGGLADTIPKDTLDLAAAQGNVEQVQAGGHEDDDDEASRARFAQDIDDLQQRIAGMELVDAVQPSSEATGAIAILAGLGGPDAVRQLLAGLSPGFPRPILIQQRLDGARHDKLVRQMQRATRMPVALAEAGQSLQAGHVYILPQDLGVVAEGAGLRFIEGGGDAVFAGLPASDSAVVLLSGSDPDVVDAAMAHALHGALVAGQAEDGCYDVAAPKALIARGAEAGSPAGLAGMLSARWPQ